MPTAAVCNNTQIICYLLHLWLNLLSFCFGVVLYFVTMNCQPCATVCHVFYWLELMVQVSGGRDFNHVIPTPVTSSQNTVSWGWLSFSLHFSPVCTVCPGASRHSAVVGCGTAGTVFWGVIWGFLTLHSANFSVSHGCFLLLSATLPSNTPECRLPSVLSFLSLSPESVNRSWLSFGG